MTNNETLADIIAEMRQRIQAARDYPQDIDITTGDVEDWADRIEAAAVREIRAERTEAIDEALAHAEEVRAEKCRNCERAPGNAAAMREALEELVYLKCLVQGSCGKPMDELCTHTGCIWHPYRAALAAPPRNCDRFGSYEDALEYWREHVECAEDNGSFDVWLMAHAEGGAEC